MAGEYYDHTGYPANSSAGTSAAMRAELIAIETGFNKLPTMAAKGDRVVVVNHAATAQETRKLGIVDAGIAGDIVDENSNEIIKLAGVASAVNEVTLTNAATGNPPTLTASGSDTNIGINIVTKGSGVVTLGGVAAVTTSGSQTLTTKTINLANNTLTGTLAEFSSACSDADFASLAGSETLTTKTINLANNTVTGTLAEFNSACSDADFASIGGTETLTAKTVNLANNTVTGTLAEFNTACSDANFASIAGTETLTGKTVNLANNTLTGTLAQFNTACSDANFASIAGTETLTGKTITDLTLIGKVTEDVYEVTGTTPVIDPANGTVQTWALSGNSTPTGNLAAGTFVTLMISDGTAYTVTWSSIPVVWVGGSAPLLATSGFTIVELWKVGTTTYGARVGDVA